MMHHPPVLPVLGVAREFPPVHRDVVAAGRSRRHAQFPRALATGWRKRRRSSAASSAAAIKVKLRLPRSGRPRRRRRVGGPPRSPFPDEVGVTSWQAFWCLPTTMVLAFCQSMKRPAFGPRCQRDTAPAPG